MEYPDGYEFGLWLNRYFEFKEWFETLLSRPGDLVMVGVMHNSSFLRSGDESRRSLYAA